MNGLLLLLLSLLLLLLILLLPSPLLTVLYTEYSTLYHSNFLNPSYRRMILKWFDVPTWNAQRYLESVNTALVCEDNMSGWVCLLEGPAVSTFSKFISHQLKKEGDRGRLKRTLVSFRLVHQCLTHGIITIIVLLSSILQLVNRTVINYE